MFTILDNKDRCVSPGASLSTAAVAPPTYEQHPGTNLLLHACTPACCAASLLVRVLVRHTCCCRGDRSQTQQGCTRHPHPPLEWWCPQQTAGWRLQQFSQAAGWQGLRVHTEVQVLGQGVQSRAAGGGWCPQQSAVWRLQEQVGQAAVCQRFRVHAELQVQDLGVQSRAVGGVRNIVQNGAGSSRWQDARWSVCVQRCAANTPQAQCIWCISN